MAQQIKHRRGSISNISAITPVVDGEIIVGSGSLGSLTGPVTFIGGATTYAPIAKIYSGSSVPDASTNTFLQGLPFYNTTNKSLVVVQGTTGSRLDLAGNVSGSIIYPASISASGDISASNLWLSGNASVSGNIALYGNITVGDSNTDYVVFAADVSSSFLPDIANSFDLGASGKEWRTIYAQQGVFTSASGSFSGSFVGNGAGLTGLVTTLTVVGDGGLSGSIDLKTKNLKILGTTNEIETLLQLNAGSDGYTVQIGLPDNVTIGGDITVGGNDIKSSGGSIAVTLSGSDVTIAGDLQVSGNDIKSSTGNSVITLSGTDATFNQNVTVTGNLTVNGTSTIVNSTTVEIGDNIISLNGSGVTNAGLVVRDATASSLVSGSLLWDTTNDYWISGKLGSEKRIAVQNASSLTTNALIYGNASSEIVSIPAPSAADQYAKWDGSAWVMTNVIDGGTF
jgi:hypothetical protein